MDNKKIKQISKQISKSLINWNFDKAIIFIFCLLISLPSISQTNEKLELALEYNHSGNIKYQNKDYFGAIQDFTEALKLDPKLAKKNGIYYNRGYAKMKVNDLIGAIMDFNKSIDNDFRLDKGITGIASEAKGDCKYELGDFRGAILDYTTALSIFPKSKDCLIGRGFAKLVTDDLNGACLDWSKAGNYGSSAAYELINEYCN